jgi:hypothetical protein
MDPLADRVLRVWTVGSHSVRNSPLTRSVGLTRARNATAEKFVGAAWPL